MFKTRPLTNRKKRRGVFYTPNSISAILCEWAVRQKNDYVLEPSFGGCGFIHSLCERFRKLGSQSPAASIYGCDIDAKAFLHLKDIERGSSYAGHFLKADFLQLSLSDFGCPPFDAVVGNPPYVAYHNMFLGQRKTTSNFADLGDFRLSRTSSLWAYFVLHGFRFLKVGGRAAWVLPGSLLHADYGKALLHGVAPFFKRVVVISLKQRVFLNEGTEESSEILLCEGWKLGPAKNGVEVCAAETIEECQKFIKSWNSDSWKGSALNGRAMFALVSHDALSDYYHLLKDKRIKKFGDIARILIGIVTGDNAFFVLNRKQARDAGIANRQLALVLSKFRFAPGLLLKRGDLLAAVRLNERCLLANRRSLKGAPPAVRRYFESFPANLLHEIATFAKRSIWHCPDDSHIPDAFFPYMNHVGPRLLLNSARVNSTNTVHRVYFPPRTSMKAKKLAAISMLTSFSQLSAELEGRTYGAGVLKHEPSEASNIKLVMPTDISLRLINKTTDQIDALLRLGKHDEARVQADVLVFGEDFVRKHSQLFVGLNRALVGIRQRRY